MAFSQHLLSYSKIRNSSVVGYRLNIRTRSYFPCQLSEVHSKRYLLENVLNFDGSKIEAGGSVSPDRAVAQCYIVEIPSAGRSDSRKEDHRLHTSDISAEGMQWERSTAFAGKEMRWDGWPQLVRL